MAIEVNATIRTEPNPRKLRREGFIPGVVYGKDVHHSIQIASRDLQKVLASATRSSRFEVKVDGNSYDAFLRDVQYHPLSDSVLHIDFYQPDAERQVKMDIPIRLVGTPIGLKIGGVLSQVREYLPVRGLRGDIPEIVEVDVSNMDVGGVLRLADLPLEGVSIMIPLDSSIATVKIPRRLALELEAEEGAEGEEGAEVAEGAAAAPEGGADDAGSAEGDEG